jgi:hypothetical protein
MGVAKRASPEEDLHRACYQWVQWQEGRYPLLKHLFHSPNGGLRKKGEAGKLKAMGARPGVPDFLLPIPNGQWSGLAIELKSTKGILSEYQRDWLEALKSANYRVAVVRDLDAFIATTQDFLGG